jgi:hypothetical protein
MMGGNVLPMIFNEFLQPWKDISRTGPHTWGLYWNPITQWEWDDNHFFNNQIFHPIQGNFYYNAARSNGFGYYESLLSALVGSFLWECCSERRPGAYNDLANTSLGGAALGEMLFRATSLIIDNDARGLNRVGLEAMVLPLNAERFMARGVYGEWNDTANPAGRTPDEWGLSLGAGLRGTGGSPHGVVDLELRYGSLYGNHDLPFEHFTASVQLNGRNEPIGLVRVEAHLEQFDWLFGSAPSVEASGRWTRGNARLVLTQNYDYLDSSDELREVEVGTEEGYRYGGQSIGLGLVSGGPIGSWSWEGQVQIEGIPIGAINSLYADYSAIFPERKREYDYGIGGGGRLRGQLLWPGVLRASGAYQFTLLQTLNGSNICGGVDCRTVHWIHAVGFAGKLNLDRLFWLVTRTDTAWARDFWVGFDYFWFKKRSNYEPDILTPPRTGENHIARQWRVLVTWDIAR